MKRFVCFLLTMVMLLGMIPMTAINANAASNWSTSSRAINEILTRPDRFQEFAQDGGYIGYGTQAKKADGTYATTKAEAAALYPDGISEDKAIVLLEEYLEDVVDEAINEFTSDRNVDLTQAQHDALAIFSMEMKNTSWLSDGSNPFREAVRTRKVGQELLNAIAHTFIGTVSNTEGFRVQMNLRFSIANLYLNSDYAYICPKSFTYVVLHFADGSNDVLAYNSNSPMTLAVKDNSTGKGDKFLGWYLPGDIDEDDGLVINKVITKLDSSVSRETLVSRFNGETGYKYRIKSDSLISRFVFDAAYSKAQYKTHMSDEALEELDKANKKLASGTEFSVRSEKMVDGIKWLHGSGKNRKGDTITGWVYLGELPQEGVDLGDVIATATITSSKADMYEGATAQVDTGIDVPKGVTVNVYDTKVEKTNTGNKTWAKIIYNGVTGWIDLERAEVTNVTDTNDSPDGRTGTIVNEDKVNVRNNPGMDGTSVITTLKKGTKVTILRTEKVINADGTSAQWGLVEWDGLKDGYTKGWVYMFYVNVEGLEQTKPGNTPSADTLLYTGVVNSNIALNVRSAPRITPTNKVGSLNNGTQVNIYEIETASNGVKWGRIDEDRWICLQYVNLTKVENAGSSTTTVLQATVTVASLDICKNFTSNAAKLGTLKKGDVVVILEKNTEKTETGSRIWGRIIKDGIEGWINLAYVDLKTVASVGGSTSTGSATSNANGANGVVSNCISVNVRKAAGVSNAQITKLNNGTAVKVYNQVTKDSAPWARITWVENGVTKEGWVCMNYVTVSAAGANTNANGSTITGTNSNTISATGTVNSATLRVRSGAGTEYLELGKLAKGAQVTIFEQVVSNGAIWGRINYNNAAGWVCMGYITVDNTSVTGNGVMGTIARCANAVNVRSAPGTGNALVGTIGVGKRVEVFETRSYGNGMWARVAQGWISMDYVLMDSELPPGTALDATQPTAAPTQAPEPAPTINKDNEVKYVIDGVVSNGGNAIVVRNDTSDDSAKIGTIVDGKPLNILAVKNNNAELWGRVDQYATAGWVNMKNVSYSVTGYVNTNYQPVYADPSTESTVKGTLVINTKLTITKLTVSGGTVYGWVTESDVNGEVPVGLNGWIPMGRIDKNRIEVDSIYIYTSTMHPTGPNLSGRTNTSTKAYEEAGSSEVVYTVYSGATVYINEIDLENGVAWGKIIDQNNDVAWVNLNNVTYSMTVSITDAIRVWKTRDTSNDENSHGKLEITDSFAICELSFDADGRLWGKVTNNTKDPAMNGGYVLMKNVTAPLSIEYR